MTVAAVVLAAAITLFETTTFRPRFVTSAQADARLLAELLVPALEFDDERTAALQLASLARRPEFAGALIQLPDGRLFAAKDSVRRAREKTLLPPNGPEARIDGRVVTVIEPIRGQDGLLGWLRLEIELPTAGKRLYYYGIFALAAVASLAVLAALLSYVLRRAVAEPVEILLRATQAVSEKKDYALRVPVEGRDEFGRLADAFNEMLSALGERDAESRRHQRRLARHNRGLVEIAQAELAVEGEPGSQLRIILAILSRAHEVRRVGLWLFNEDDTRLRCAAAYDAVDETYQSGAELAVAEAPEFFEALRRDPVLAITDVAGAPLAEPLSAGQLKPAGITALLVVPVRRHGRLVGALWHEHAGAPRRWESEEINFASAVSDRVVLILEGEELRVAQVAVREVEARYQQMVEAAPDAIFTLDGEARIREPNSALNRLTGWPPEHWDGRTLAESVREADRADARQAVETVAQNGERRVVTLAFVKADGGEVALECFLVPGRAGSGRYDVLCVGRDQTERLAGLDARARLEDQLRQSQKMEAVGTLAGGIAHDFNNILTAILGNLQLIDEELPAGHGSRRYVKNSLGATYRARDLVRQILTFSRRQEARRSPVGLAGILKEALGLLRASLPSSIEIVCHCDPDTPPILADETQIHQVIMNLATNAFHAMEPNGGKLEITVRVREAGAEERRRHPQLREGEQVVLAMTDTGCGMDAVTQERLFEPFFTTKPQGKGTGLGMAVVHGILEAHEARVAVRSAPGEGTTFSVFFPPWRTETEEGIRVPEGESREWPQGKAGRSVLLVDDESAVVEIAEILLRRNGFQVRCFGDPREALAEFVKDPEAYDLLLTDLTMPHMSGIELAGYLRALNPRLRVLIMTGYGGDHDTSSFAAAGIMGSLQKPFSSDELFARIEDVLKSAG